MKSVLAAAAVVAAVLLPAAPVAAAPICVGVEKIGTTGPPLAVGPICVPYNGLTNCRVTDIGISPSLILRVTTCVPR